MDQSSNSCRGRGVRTARRDRVIVGTTDGRHRRLLYQSGQDDVGRITQYSSVKYIIIARHAVFQNMSQGNKGLLIDVSDKRLYDDGSVKNWINIKVKK